MYKLKSSLLLIFAITLVSGVKAQNAQEIIKNVQAKYDKISDAKATFSQSIKGSGKGASGSGTVYIKKEDYYRIEIGGQTIITDGKTSWSYNPKKKQVVIDNYKDDGNTFSPNKFLFKYPENFYSDLESEENISGIDCYVIKLTPRTSGNIKSAKIWIDKNENLIKKITISSKESTSTYTLKNIDLNAGLSSSKFTFSPPAGVEVIDLR
ncbi:outer membrane lipoprotein carrier protein LolA [soil metagenome]